MTWFKVDVRVQCSPRLRVIGAQHGSPAQKNATLVWLAVLGVNAEHNCQGVMDPIYADAGYLATYCPALNAIEFRAAIDHLTHVELIEVDGSLVHIPGWDHTWLTVKPSTERVRRHRQLKAERKAQLRGVGGGT